MAKKENKPAEVKEEKKKLERNPEDDVILVRVLGKDIRGNKKLGAALTEIRGISWTFANAICKILKLDKGQAVQDVDKKKLDEIENFIKDPKIPAFLKNRQKDLESGEDQHISGTDLKLRTEFDIKRMKKINSYKGIRHTRNLPVRGQRTKGNFRRNRKKSVAAAKKKE